MPPLPSGPSGSNCGKCGEAVYEYQTSGRATLGSVVRPVLCGESLRGAAQLNGSPDVLVAKS